MKINLELKNENFRHSAVALLLAEKFHREFHDRVGSYQGVAYSATCDCGVQHSLMFYVYRTGIGTIMVRES